MIWILAGREESGRRYYEVRLSLVSLVAPKQNKCEEVRVKSGEKSNGK